MFKRRLITLQLFVGLLDTYILVFFLSHMVGAGIHDRRTCHKTPDFGTVVKVNTSMDSNVKH